MAFGRQGRLEPRAGPAFQPTGLSGPGLCAAVLGPQMGNNRAASTAREQRGVTAGESTPTGATGLEAHGAEEKCDPDSSAKHRGCG